MRYLINIQDILDEDIDISIFIYRYKRTVNQDWERMQLKDLFDLFVGTFVQH